MIILKNKTAEETEEIIRQVRAEIEFADEQSDIPISVAMGYVWTNAEEKNLQELIHCADEKMYQDKKQIKEKKETIVSGEVWVNRNFLDGYPMYMNGIHKDGELVMLIFIQEVGDEQLSLYYLNLFQILCGLVETALLRALEYQEAIKNRQYVQGTRILKPEYFEERLYSFHSMREENRASYVLLKLEYYPQMTLEEADTALQASVRENDVWGISEKGELFLILSQTDRSSLPIILARLENDGFVCHEIDTVENANTGEKL